MGMNTTITPMPAGVDVRKRTNGQTWIIVHDLELGSLRFPLSDNVQPESDKEAIRMALQEARRRASMLPTKWAVYQNLKAAYLEALIHRQAA
jgi:hypothetical protein